MVTRRRTEAIDREEPRSPNTGRRTGTASSASGPDDAAGKPAAEANDRDRLVEPTFDRRSRRVSVESSTSGAVRYCGELR